MTGPAETTARSSEALAGDALFAETKERFHLPAGVVYLDGNSLGAQPKAVAPAMAAALERGWGDRLIRAWNEEGWVDLPVRLGAAIAPFLGAASAAVRVGDSTSVNLFKALSAAFALRPERPVILTDSGNFPTDLYIADALARRLGATLRVVEPGAVAGSIDETVGVVTLTEVDYRTGRRHDVPGLTRAAHAAGAVVVWDLSHSVGALPLALSADRVDFAVGCTYKYLNGGPGAPAFLYVRPDHAATADPLLAGWFGHADPFAFEPAYRPAEGVDRFRVGTPPILSMVALDAALTAWRGVTVAAARARALALQERFIEAIAPAARRHGLVLASPAEAERRGGHISYRTPDAYPLSRALTAAGVIGDMRAPDILRLGFAPLYLTPDAVDRAAATLNALLETRGWDRPEHHARARVT